MVRDARMQALVAKEHEPITPFVDRVRELAGSCLDTARDGGWRTPDAADRRGDATAAPGRAGAARESPAPT
jgi:hypothetical protein